MKALMRWNPFRESEESQNRLKIGARLTYKLEANSCEKEVQLTFAHIRTWWVTNVARESADAKFFANLSSQNAENGSGMRRTLGNVRARHSMHALIGMGAWLNIASIIAVFLAATTQAQVPVIIDAFDLVTLGANEAYDPATNSWTQKTAMPTPRLQGVIEQVDGIIYAVGGVEGLGGSGRTGGGSGEGKIVPLVEAYDPVTDSWTAKTPMPEERSNMASGTIGGILYIAGGYRDDTSTTNTLFAYDAATDTWTTKHPMPSIYTVGAAAGVIGGKLYVVGGVLPNGNGAGTGSMIVYDPATDSWDETKAPMPTPRFDLSVVVLDGKLYAIGGTPDQSGYTAVVEAYDPATDTWTTKTPMLADRSLFAAGVFNNTIYVFGGIGFRHPIGFNLNDVEAFDPAANGGMGSWTQKEPMPTPRNGFGGQFINGIFYAIGGNRLGTATVGQPYIFQVTATNQPTSYGASDLPPGLSMDSATGLIHGIPTAAGRYTGQLDATNASGTGHAPLSIGVFPAPDPGALAIVSSTCATGRTGQPFSFAVQTSGAGPTTHFSFGSIPPGLSGNQVTGVISGTPTSDDSFTVSVTAVDGALVASSVLQLTFTSDPGVPIITSPDFATLTPGEFFSYTLTADVDGNFTYIGTDGQINGALPADLSYHSDTHIISGIYNPGGASAKTRVSSQDLRQTSSFSGHGTRIKKEPPTGILQLVASNDSGTGTAPLNLVEARPTLGNISTRGAVETGDGVMIGGFIIQGTDTKRVMIRAVGPSLDQYGLNGLSDPILELHDSNGVIATNNDWQTTQIGGVITADQASDIQSSGLAPSDASESAMIVTLPPGNYTAIIHGASNGTGIALAEVYDLTLDVNSVLANISTRGSVETGDSVMIGGFIIPGSEARTVMVRAIGPSLDQYGLNGLNDPVLELHDTNGVIATNDNWQTTQIGGVITSDQASDIQNSGLAPTQSSESAMIVTLQPGNYTAIVHGVNGATGIGLVEVYQLQ